MFTWTVIGVVAVLLVAVYVGVNLLARQFKCQRKAALEAYAQLSDPQLKQLLQEGDFKGRKGAIQADAACAEAARRASKDVQMWRLLEELGQDRKSLRGRLALAYLNSLRQQGL
ncbi:MAG: hypothetical protein E1N59_1258 [Puniceicoccaceae bacterium 5H]|nr:MAG: hypothetical protein E1N59_1258 [Puniceicoccaceae bacterium 5H]